MCDFNVQMVLNESVHGRIMLIFYVWIINLGKIFFAACLLVPTKFEMIAGGGWGGYFYQLTYMKKALQNAGPFGNDLKLFKIRLL